MKDMRAFIAIPLSGEIQNLLEKITVQIGEKTGNKVVRWVNAPNIHLTLKFLGNVPLPHIESLKRILDKEGSQTTAFEIQVGGVGAFPDLRKPRVIWIGIQAPTSLADLQRRIDRETVRLGYESEERAFSPHLTLGRLSRDASPEDGRRVGQVLSGMQTGTLGSVTVNEIHLYQSDLRPGGAIYTLIHRAELITKNIYSTAR